MSVLVIGAWIVDQNKAIYLDYAASAPLDKRVLREMMPYFEENFGNPASIHSYGQRAEAAIESARERVATTFRVTPQEVVFTSGGTESDNLAIRGAAFSKREITGANRILISPVEHHAVLETAQQLSKHFGFIVEFLSVDEFGRVDPEEVDAGIKPDTAIVSVIYANNEIGTINPIREIAAICREKGVLFHTDAVQAAAHLTINLNETPVDLLSIGAHKFYGPKGIGSLIARKGAKLVPVITGGAQEFSLRAGTSNVPYIVGLAEALKLTSENREPNSLRMRALRDRLIEGVLESIPRAKLTGHPVERLPNHASFVFEGADANLLLVMLDMAGFACSSGSACKVGSPKPSEILKAIGLSSNWAMGSLRVTLGVDTTLEIVEKFLKALPPLVEQARSLKA
ncbi:MAG: cysteine desulfurase [Anaerolineaceae bacterium]|nr:cysteine desulfurase [Anaerolineaceae bacterium]